MKQVTIEKVSISLPKHFTKEQIEAWIKYKLGIKNCIYEDECPDELLDIDLHDCIVIVKNTDID